jgi:putative DNA primase/helicase
MRAEEIGRALGGFRHGGGWLARCPCPNHGRGKGDRNPSLSIGDGHDGRLLMRCFAGCEFVDVLGELKHRGINTTNEVQKPRAPAQPPKIEPSKLALDIWNSAKPLRGTVGEQYLQRRGILLTPSSLRFGGSSMVAALRQPYVGVTAVQRTPIDSIDLTRGQRQTDGPMGTGAVRLGDAKSIMGLAEGVETALAAMMLSGMPVWASLGSARLHRVELPPLVQEVHVFGDNDEAGKKAADRTAETHLGLGRTVHIHFPRQGSRDFNDALLADADDWNFNHE